MMGKRMDLVVTLLLLLIVIVTVATGLLADATGVPRSLFHRYSGYALAALVAVHVALRWQDLVRTLGVLAWRPGQESFVPRDRPVAVSPDRPPERLGRRALILAGAAALSGLLLGRWLWRPALPVDGATDLGMAYHQWSKPSYQGVLAKPLDWGMPPGSRETADAERIALPREISAGEMSLDDAISRRRSVRDYAARPLTVEQLAGLLHLACGITDAGRGLRAAPSAGALYPTEIYPVIHNVDGLRQGIYRYLPDLHSLELLRGGDFRTALLLSCLGQDAVAGAGVVFVLTAVFQRTRWRYGDRAYRYVLLEAGHIGENLYLAATAMGLGPCGIGAFLDDGINQVLGVNGTSEAAVYLVAVGAR